VQALAAGPEPAARAITGPGDEAVHGDGDPSAHLTHGPPGSDGCVEIGYSLAPSARGQGIGSAAVAAFVGSLAAVPGIRRITAVTAAQNAASRRLLERQGFRIIGLLPGTGEVRYSLSLG
jgi:RimJ/RimL family protein N-acetyltransferase